MRSERGQSSRVRKSVAANVKPALYQKHPFYKRFPQSGKMCQMGDKQKTATIGPGCTRKIHPRIKKKGAALTRAYMAFHLLYNTEEVPSLSKR